MAIPSPIPFPQKILEAADKQQDVVELDLPGVKKLFLGLERKIQVMNRKRGRLSGGGEGYGRLEGTGG